MKLMRGFVKIIVVTIFMIVAYNICKITPFYIEKVHYAKDEIRLIIDDEEKTKSLPEAALIEDNKIFLSIDTVRKYFDEYLYYDEKYETVIAASGEYVIKMPLNSSTIRVNDEEKNITHPAKKIDFVEEEIYIPAEEIFSLCNISGDEVSNGLREIYSSLRKIYNLSENPDENIVADVNNFELLEIEKNNSNAVAKPIKKNGKVLFSLGFIRKYFDVDVKADDELNKIEIIYDYSIPTDDGTLESYSRILKTHLNQKNIVITEYKYIDNADPSDDTLETKKLSSNKKKIEVPVQKFETTYNTIYIPIEELATMYNLDIKYNEKIIITTNDAKYYTAAVDNRIHVKKHKKELCKTTEIVSKRETLDIFNTDFNLLEDDEYVWVRTENGSLGYVKKANIKIKEDLEDKTIKSPKKELPKISLVWEYASNYSPDRSDEKKIEAIDIISPTWVYVKNTSGDLKENVSQNYLTWARNQDYDVWPTIKNDDIGIDKTSILLNDMHARKQFIDNTIALCKKYNFKGINLDFEHMYKADSEEYAQLVRELSVALRINGIISSVDVNVPDGSPNWSLCFDSKAISDAVDYIIVMAYDQYGASSSVAGPVASLDWVEINLKKMIQRDGIDSKKLVLGVPFYSRYWREKNNAVVATTAVGMSQAKEYMKEHPNSTNWVESAGQYKVSYNASNGQVTVWVEDENSLEKKLELIDKYQLAGVAAWRRGFENADVWSKIEEAMK